MSNFKKMRQFCTVGNDNFRNKSFKKVQDMVPNIRNFKLVVISLWKKKKKDNR